jgi:hypothetical protein
VSAVGWLKGLRAELVTMSKQERVRREHLGLWEDAESYAELCALMERFVLGELEAWPYHQGPRDPETEEIAHALAHANRRGYLTTGSQPGRDTPDSWAGRWEQRAEVSGFATDDVRDRLLKIMAPEPMISMQVHRASPRFLTRSVDHSTSVTITRVEGRRYTTGNGRLNRRAVEFMWQGIHDRLVAEILPMNQVSIIDTEFGPHTRLWDRLVML